MSNLKQKHKDYLIKNEIKDLTDLVNYVEILRNTSNLQGEDRQMLFDFAFLITNEQLSLQSFFAENKNPSKEFYNAFKKFSKDEDKSKWVRVDFYYALGNNRKFIEVAEFVSLEDAKKYFNDSKNTEAFYYKYGTRELIEKEEKSKNSPTFMDEVLGQSNYDSAFNEGFTSLKKEDWKALEENRTGTTTEVPIWVTNGYRLGFKDLEKYVKIELDDSKQKFGKKETEGKLFYELDFEFIKQMAERMQSNKDNSKYELWNWKKPLSEKDLEELKQAMWRHIIAVMSGELEDDDRPFGHLEAISNNAMMINYQLKLKKC